MTDRLVKPEAPDMRDLTKALSDDVRFLGSLLGDIIRAQHGSSALDLVETVRRAAKDRRQNIPSATERLTQTINETTLDQKLTLIKAFSNYFQLINIAEDLQRLRVLRQREHESKLSESITTAILELKQVGLSATDMQGLLQRLSARLVLTAHPSEAKRQEVLVKLQHIAQHLAVKDRQILLEREKRRMVAELYEEIEELWQTRVTRAVRATVADEVNFGLYFVANVLMDVLVEIYNELRDVLQQAYPTADWSQLPICLRYASWIGGDRDGNPNVTADVSLSTLETQRKTALEVYIKSVQYLRDHLTQSESETGISDELRAQSTITENSAYPDEHYRIAFDQILGKLQDAHRRTLNDLLDEKLNEKAFAQRGLDKCYTAEAFLDDLWRVDHSLRANKGQHVADGSLRDLITKVQIFGFHLLPLDIREDSQKNLAALHEIFANYGTCADYRALPEDQKQTLLTAEIANARPLFNSDSDFSPTTMEVINTWRMIRTAHRAYGKVSIDTVIASMCQHPSDVLAMLLLATKVGIQNDIDIVPLFETIEDLHNSSSIMSTLFENPLYNRHLVARNQRQQIMLGYSDSNKDGGYLASNWGLYTTQSSLAKLCEQRGINLELFHGRGGSIGRGGGPTHQSILSQPPGSMHGRLKITEQGEVIAYRYSNPEISRRHLHHVLHAVLLSSGLPVQAEPAAQFRSAMDELADRGMRAYRLFVYETPGFLEYWSAATPIDELSNMQMSSRPAKRRGGGFSGLRAIPWVFSWMQSRAIIPSWYGVGTAFEQFCTEHPDGLSMLRQMYSEWIFFRTLIENVQLDVAKADMGIAALYASLVKTEALRDTIFGQIQAEHARATQMICQITEQTTLLSASPVMQRSIERRNPYVDPLNFIQVALLRDLRALTPEDPAYAPTLSAVLATINGIAAGMKTTG